MAVIFENSQFKISAEWGNAPYSNETNFIEVFRKNSTVKSIRVNDATYNFYDSNNTIFVDVSDFIRVYNTDKFEFFDENNVSLYTHNYTANVGFKPIVSELIPPTRITFIPTYTIAGGFVFKITLYMPEHTGKPIEQLINATWINIGTVSGNVQTFTVSKDAVMVRIKDINTVQISSTFDLTFDLSFGVGFITVDSSYYFKLELPECIYDYVLLEWSGENGGIKHFFFKRSSTLRSYDNTVNLSSISNPNGWNVLKNKIIDFTLVLERAELTTRKYIADLFISDFAYMHYMGEKRRILIDNNKYNISESEKRENINFTVRFKNYNIV